MRELKDDHIIGMLSDIDIKHFIKNSKIEIISDNSYSPFDEGQIQPGSIDLRLRNEVKYIINVNGNIPYENQVYTKPFELQPGQPLIMQPGQIILATTIERVRLSKEFAGFITGRSSIARLGVLVQCSQDFINPGHDQAIPLQLINLNKNNVELKLENPICQLILFRFQTPPSLGYTDKCNPKYKNERTPMDSGINNDYLTDKRSSILENPISYTIKFYDKWIMPFAPSIIVSTIIIPFFFNAQKSSTFGEMIRGLIDSASSLPVYPIITIIFLLIYIIRKNLHN